MKKEANTTTIKANPTHSFQRLKKAAINVNKAIPETIQMNSIASILQLSHSFFIASLAFHRFATSLLYLGKRSLNVFKVAH